VDRRTGGPAVIRKQSSVISGDRTAGGLGVGVEGCVLSEDSHVRRQATIHV